MALLALVLAWVGGFVDGAGYLLLSGVFVAHQSGNTVASTVGVAQGDWSLIARRAAPVALFVIGVAVAAVVLEIAGRRRVPALTSITLGAEVALLVGGVVVSAFVPLRGHAVHVPLPEYIGLLTFLVLAMGLQTATLRKIGRKTVRTTYVTGMLTHFAEDLVSYFVDRHDTHSSRGKSAREESLREKRDQLRLRGAIWVSYALGGIVGAFAELGLHGYALAAPAGVLAVVVAIDQCSPWHAPEEDPLRDN